MLIIGSLTLGIWVIWLLVRSGANLTAQVMLDGVLLPAQPKLAAKISTQSWWRTATELTLAHFFSLAVLAGIFAGTLRAILPD